MKALVYTGPESLSLRDMPDPVPGVGDALVRIGYSGICGSDMHAYLGHDDRRPAPLILGHEASGVVVGGPMQGQRVTINPLVTCGNCAACTEGRTNLCARRQIISMPPREGAFADYVALPERNLIPLPDHADAAKAALCEPLACGWHAVRLGVRALGREATSLRCAVLGGGAIGVGGALALAAFGAVDITLVEPNRARRDTLLRQPQFRTLPANGLDTSAHDLILDGVGTKTTRAAACAAICPGGVIVHIGLGQAAGGLDARRMTLQEVTFIGTYTYTAQDFRDTAQAIFDGRLGALDWAETRPLAEGAAAFADIRAGRAAAPKIILIP